MSASTYIRILTLMARENVPTPGPGDSWDDAMHKILAYMEHMLTKVNDKEAEIQSLKREVMFAEAERSMLLHEYARLQDRTRAVDSNVILLPR